MVQKTIIDTLHKEGKSQKVITERGGCSQSAVSNHIKCKADWKEEIGQEKVHKQQGWPQAWEYYQAKPIQTVGRASQGVNWSWSQCIKSHHAQTSSGKGQPSHFWNRNYVRSLLPGLKRKITGLLLSGPKSSFQIKANFAFQLEIKVWSLEEEWRGTESKLLEVHCEVSEFSDDLGFRDVCWCWSIMFYQVQSQYSHLPGYFGALYASICWQALWRCWFPFSAGLLHLSTVPKPLPSGLLTIILLCLIDQPTCLTWTPYGIYGIFSRERWVDPTVKTSRRLNNASAVPQADRFHATPQWCWSLC